MNFLFNDTLLETLDANATGSEQIILGPILELERIDLEYVVIDVILSGSDIIVKVSSVSIVRISIGKSLSIAIFVFFRVL